MELQASNIIALLVALVSIGLSVYNRLSDSTGDKFKELDDKHLKLLEKITETEIKHASLHARVASNESLMKELQRNITDMKKSLDKHFETLTKIETKLEN